MSMYITEIVHICTFNKTIVYSLTQVNSCYSSESIEIDIPSSSKWPCTEEPYQSYDSDPSTSENNTSDCDSSQSSTKASYLK